MLVDLRNVSIQACFASLKKLLVPRDNKTYAIMSLFVQRLCNDNNFGEIKRIMKMFHCRSVHALECGVAFVLIITSEYHFVIKTATIVICTSARIVNQRKSLITTSAHSRPHDKIYSKH